MTSLIASLIISQELSDQLQLCPGGASDPSAFLNVYDPDKEADKVAGYMADGLAPEQVAAAMDATLAAADENEGDWLMELFGAGQGADTPGLGVWAAVICRARAVDRLPTRRRGFGGSATS